jgi:hypothetical protein
MENKYYTPEIKEFHVGFEYERCDDGYSYFKDIYPRAIDTNKLENYLPYFRVKYLDKEDIENLGYRESNIKPDIFSPKGFYLEEDLTGFLLFLLKNNQVIIYSRDMTRTWLQPPSFNEEFTICFRGILKNKSELKKLMQQLTINKL